MGNDGDKSQDVNNKSSADDDKSAEKANTDIQKSNNNKNRRNVLENIGDAPGAIHRKRDCSSFPGAALVVHESAETNEYRAELVKSMYLDVKKEKVAVKEQGVQNQRDFIVVQKKCVLEKAKKEEAEAKLETSKGEVTKKDEQIKLLEEEKNTMKSAAEEQTQVSDKRIEFLETAVQVKNA